MLLFSIAALDSCPARARADIVLPNGSSDLRAYYVTRVNCGICGLRAHHLTLVISHRFLLGFSSFIQVLFLLSPFSSGPDLHLFKDLAPVRNTTVSICLLISTFESRPFTLLYEKTAKFSPKTRFSAIFRYTKVANC